MITPGETSDALSTVYFTLWTREGLSASGGSDPDWDGMVYPSSPTLMYENNISGDHAATGTFTVLPNGVGAYTFSPAERATSKAEGTIAIKVDGGSMFRRQVMRVQFGGSLQPGETDVNKRRIFTTLYTTPNGYIANGGSNDYYEGPLASGLTLTYQHNMDTVIAATGGSLTLHGTDEWYYDPSDSEVSISKSKGTIALIVVGAGIRPQIERIGFGLIDGGASGSVISINAVKAKFDKIYAIVKFTGDLTVAYDVGGLPIFVYATGEGFAPFFADQSSATDLGDGTWLLTLLPNGGWWASTFRIRIFSSVELELAT